MHKIYALFDYELNEKRGKSFEDFISLALEKNAIYLQYRDKISKRETKIENIKKLRELWSGVLLVNDDIGLVSYCDGLHLGQEDIYQFSLDISEAAKEIREQIGDKILGLSTHNSQEIEIANKIDLDYIGLGAYRDTTTKNVSKILGESLPILAKESKHKVAAIGGVKKDDKIKYVDFLVLGSDIYED